MTLTDNAKYQKCALVMNLAVELKIEMLYLTAYSTNLNLIERLWKLFVKKRCLYLVYYPDFNSFKKAITGQFLLDPIDDREQWLWQAMAKPTSDRSSPNQNWDKPSPSVPSPSMATSTLIERLATSATLRINFDDRHKTLDYSFANQRF